MGWDGWDGIGCSGMGEDEMWWGGMGWDGKLSLPPAETSYVGAGFLPTLGWVFMPIAGSLSLRGPDTIQHSIRQRREQQSPDEGQAGDSSEQHSRGTGPWQHPDVGGSDLHHHHESHLLPTPRSLEAPAAAQSAVRDPFPVLLCIPRISASLQCHHGGDTACTAFGGGTVLP